MAEVKETKEQQPYIYTMDPFPQESQDQNRLYTFYDNLREGKLSSTKCKACGHIPWPPRVVCPKCMSDDIGWEIFPETGEIHAFTIQEAGVPAGYKAPLVLVMVRFPNGVKFFCRMVDGTDPKAMEIGKKVRLTPVKVTAPGPPDRVLPAFSLIE